MTQSPKIRLWFWDFGWCEHEMIALPYSRSPQQVIREYRRTNAFRTVSTSLVGHKPPQMPELHGPFLSSSVSESDFELITLQEFEDAIARIDKTLGPTPPDDEQWSATQRLAYEVGRRHKWLFRLRLNEDSQDCFHELGAATVLFREFICATPHTENAERLVFSFD